MSTLNFSINMKIYNSWQLLVLEALYIIHPCKVASLSDYWQHLCCSKFNSLEVVGFLSVVECPVQHVLVVCILQRKTDQEEDTPHQMCSQMCSQRAELENVQSYKYGLL